MEGEYFKSVGGETIVQRSLKEAEDAWKVLVENRENRALRKTLNMFEEMGFTE